MEDIYSIFFLEMEIFCQNRFHKLSLLIGFFLLIEFIYLEQIVESDQNINSVKSLRSNWIVSEKMIQNII